MDRFKIKNCKRCRGGVNIDMIYDKEKDLKRYKIECNQCRVRSIYVHDTELDKAVAIWNAMNYVSIEHEILQEQILNDVAFLNDLEETPKWDNEMLSRYFRFRTGKRYLGSLSVDELEDMQCAFEGMVRLIQEENADYQYACFDWLEDAIAE